MTPREGHLKRLVKIFGHLQDATGRCKSIVILPEGIREINGKGDNTTYFLENYTDVTEDIDEGLPEPRDRPLITILNFESNNAHDQVMQRLISGVMCFLVHPYTLV